jgi:Tfp pilus assembly protein PilV
MKLRRNRKGFTLIEAVLAVVLVATAFLSLSYLISNTTLFNINLDMSTTAIMLARGQMAETMAKPYANVQEVAQTSFSGDFAFYRYQIAVDYVNPGDLDTPVTGPTEYKRVVVTVTASGWLGVVQLSSVKTNV